LELSGNLTTYQLTDTSGLQVEHNALIKGNLDLTGNLELSGNLTTYQLTNTSGLLVQNNALIQGNLDVSGNLELSGNLTTYQLTDTSGLQVEHNALVKGNLDVSANFAVAGNTVLFGTLDSRIPISTTPTSPASLTLPLNPYSTIYVIDNGTNNTVTVDTTTTPYYPNMVGTTSYFVATTAAGGIQLTYNGFGSALPYNMGTPIPAPGMITMVCVGSVGSKNLFSIYPFA
jgi:hypothetical protein